MILALLKLIRLYYSLPLASGFIVILAYLTGGNLAPVIDKAILSFFSLICIISASYVFNDVCDIEIDKINCQYRMLAAGRITKKAALIYSLILFVTGIVLGAFCSVAFFLVITAITGLLVCYDLLSKRIGIFKDILVAILMTSLYPLSFTLAESMQTPRLNVLYIHPAWLFLTSLGYEMLKDIPDMKGDSRVNGRDLNYCRSKIFVITSRLFIIAASLLTLLPYMLGYCKSIYLASAIAAIILAVASTFNKPAVAIRYIYAEVFLITAGSMADLLVYGP
jgi:geranylgeranylglycerol-phosphate geranylgeranyltransferase